MTPTNDRQLPCHPCAHKSVCCTWGASLEWHEADALMRDHRSDEAVDYTSDPEDPYRTTVITTTKFGVKRQHCIFSTPEGCTIHDKLYYPQVCRGFPWHSSPDVPYIHDITICPELVDLVQIDEPST